MKEYVKQRWVAALRSGKYPQQGHGQLLRKGKYCCLGVLCDISNLGEWRRIRHDSAYEIGGDSSTGALPRRVADWAGLEGRNPAILGPFSASAVEVATLAGLNDNGFTFDQIADVIEHFL